MQELGISDDIAEHLAVSTYVQLTKECQRPRSGYLQHDAGVVVRVLSTDPITQPDGAQCYEVQWPFKANVRGLVPIAYCSPPLVADTLSAFAFELDESGHFPKPEQKEEFYEWAFKKGVDKVIAADTLAREIKYGGTLTGVPLEDAKARLRDHVREQQQEAARTPLRLEPAATPSRPPIAGAPVAAGESTPVRHEVISWKVKPDHCGKVVEGGPGTFIELDVRSVGQLQVEVPHDAPRGRMIEYTIEINTETNRAELVGVDYDRVVPMDE